MIEAHISYRLSIAEQDREPRLGYHPIMSNLTTTERFYVNDDEMALLQEVCAAQGWKLETKPVYATSVKQIVNSVNPKVWSEADDKKHAEVVARMYPERANR